MGQVLTVEQLLKDLKNTVDFEVLAGEGGLNKPITAVEINRPGLALVGFFEHFGYKRIQLLGKGEVAYLYSLSAEARINALNKIFSYDICCFVIAGRQDVPQELLDCANKHNVPILRTSLPSGKITVILTLYLEESFAPTQRIHSGLVNVYGLGVLIRGRSGIGKSEATLELIKHGHRLVADDVVYVKRIGNTLVGYAPKITKYHMEIRGLGIIDVRYLFGFSSVCDRQEIHLSVNLSEDTSAADRLGIEQHKFTLFEVDIPEITIPVQPGRNVAALIEVGAMNHRLKLMGYNMADVFIEEISAFYPKKWKNLIS